MDEQKKFAMQLADEINADHDTDLSALDILDYLGVIGAEFAEGNGGSDAYIAEIDRLAAARKARKVE